MLNNLYKVTNKTDNHFSISLSDKNHKIFKAHFPNNPLLPGFILLDICEKELNHKIKKLKKINFIKPILPNQSIDFHIKKNNENLQIKITNNETLLSTLSYSTIFH